MRFAAVDSALESDWQRDLTFVQPKVAPSEELERTRLAVECVFENRTDAVLVGGFDSDDEPGTAALHE